jgi:hypothetical protein
MISGTGSSEDEVNSAVVWTVSGGMALAKLPGTRDSQANFGSINDDGVVVGYSQPSMSPNQVGIRWDADGVPVALPVPPGTVPYGLAMAVSSTGEIAGMVNVTEGVVGAVHAVVWRPRAR